ncbi:MAG: TonB-dependent receptor [Sphingomonadales bacterium]|nr:TonB-dependent receptor [Sphingomonadales bacterium]
MLRIDGTPLNFSRSNQERLRWGINFTRPLGPVAPELRNARVRFVGSEGDLQNALPPGARIIRPEPGSAAARQFENASSRLTLSLYYTLNLVDEILTRQGGPVLDLLNGSATDARGGRSRHEVEFQATAFKHGLGARAKVKGQSGTSVRGLSASSSDSSGDLTFSSFATVDINLFANLADRFGGEKAPRWLKGTRASLGITNLFNRRPEVRDEAGLTPLSYQPAYLDPLGRLLSFSLRKVF